jgi:hypothetical protein
MENYYYFVCNKAEYRTVVIPILDPIITFSTRLKYPYVEPMKLFFQFLIHHSVACVRVLLHVAVKN